jgi:radical SAM superfamily enzyme YgiQ (UPF0313 family)
VDVKFILPALLEANDPGFRPIKYALFPPLGLAALAGYLGPDDHAVLEDEHVMRLHLDDEPDLVVMSVYITSARRAYEIADEYRRRGTYVALGGLHVSSMPDEAAAHADSIFVGPGEDIWPAFLADLRRGEAAPRYVSRQRSLLAAPPTRRDLFDRRRYLCPNSIVVSRGCPHHCDFCYKDAFYEGGISFYTQAVDAALAEIERMPGRHVYFLDDHLLGNPRFAAALFEGMRGMGRVFQGASTVDAILRSDLIERAAEAGMRSVFVGLETINPENLRLHAKRQNLSRDYDEVIRRVHGLGMMINASFVFGLDDDGPDVFDRTVEWGVARSLETATFHIMTPYPGTALHTRVEAEAGSPIATGTTTTPGTSCIGRAPWPRTCCWPATGAPIATSIAGDRSCAAPAVSRAHRRRFATSPIRAAGRSSSRSGTSSSGRAVSTGCCRSSRARSTPTGERAAGHSTGPSTSS